MNALKILWGLLVDDSRLVSVVLLSLILAFLLSSIHMVHIAAYVIWVGLIVSLWISVEHQLKLKIKK
ncbi:hypothetical protein LSG31_01270 [Fodinisporobacter ferrooxydans]|uniref:Uncharacterized protein n=1 Tax=Fodinisporobacter ferrooxydans TaxID=2901836 RepID=A0ABY4CP29_9BACL|nr:hypothetical protein LSG31_01270 [Alicyclobacillaceae bacterium MYW30-H2]